MSRTAQRRRVLPPARAWAPMLVTVPVLLAAGCSGGDAGSPAAGPPASAAHTGTFCRAASRFAADQAVIRQLAGGAATLSAAADALRAGAQMRRLAPASMAADVRVVTSRFTPFFAALVTDSGVLSKALGVEMRIASTLKTAQFQTAQAALGSYEVRYCGSAPSHGH